MNKYTIHFLATMLSYLEDQQEDLEAKSVYDFTDDFKYAADKFVTAFRDYLIDLGYDNVDTSTEGALLGGNLFLSLCGTGCGFCDCYDEKWRKVHAIAKDWAKSGGKELRFEDLTLFVNDDGRIDLDCTKPCIDEERAKLFAFPASFAATSPKQQEKAEHPPKSWHKELVRNDHAYIVDDVTGRTAAVVFDPADADVMAAAPDLLYAAERVLKIWDDLYSSYADPYEREDWKALEKAIARAKGGQKC